MAVFPSKTTCSYTMYNDTYRVKSLRVYYKDIVFPHQENTKSLTFDFTYSLSYLYLAPPVALGKEVWSEVAL